MNAMMIRLVTVALIAASLATMPATAQSPLDEKIVRTTPAAPANAATPVAPEASQDAYRITLATEVLGGLEIRVEPTVPEVGRQAYLILPDEAGTDLDGSTISTKLTDPGLRLDPPAKSPTGQWRIPARFLRDGVVIVPSLSIDVPATEAADGTIISAARSITTAALNVTVAAPAAADDKETDYTELAQAAPTLWRYYLAGAIAALVLALLAYIAWRIIARLMKRAAAIAAAVPTLPPIDEAQRALRDLASLDVYRTAGSKAHYNELSLLVRRYIERQWRVNAMEWTEDEAMERLARPSSHAAASAPELLSVLEHGSLAKYAKGEIDEPVVRADLEATRAFLSREEARLAAAAAVRAAAPKTPPARNSPTREAA